MVSYADVTKSNIASNDHGVNPSADHLERGTGGPTTIGQTSESTVSSQLPERSSSDANRAQNKAESAAKDAKSAASKKADEFNRDPDVRKAKQTLKRPEVWGSALGFLNLAILGAVGYQAYQYKDQTWDRRNVTLVSVGLAAWFGGQAVLGADQYQQHRK